jgi:SPASM domain peptide maturase of grasp-with-spasm system
MFDKDGLLDIVSFRKKLDQESQEIFNEYIELLEKQEFIFRCTKSEARHFPSLSMEWDYPSQASNCIVDISSISMHDYQYILNKELDEVNCRYVQFRHYDESSLDFWQGIVDIVNKNEIKAIDIILKDTPKLFTHDEIAKLASANRKIRSITLHSSIENNEIQASDIGFGSVIAIQETIKTNNHCGVIHPGYFAINIETFTESQHHNTCLNRKISIDVNGDIKNCPSIAKSYGNIKNTKLIDVVNNHEFQKVWHIKKDEITKCKDCEFRYVCTDCRAYIENPNDMYSAPLKCAYNPYTCEWEEWSLNPLKQQAIEYYGMSELKK